jgi:hypothetical protein
MGMMAEGIIGERGHDLDKFSQSGLDVLSRNTNQRTIMLVGKKPSIVVERIPTLCEINPRSVLSQLTFDQESFRIPPLGASTMLEVRSHIHRRQSVQQVR